MGQAEIVGGIPLAMSLKQTAMPWRWLQIGIGCPGTNMESLRGDRKLRLMIDVARIWEGWKPANGFEPMAFALQKRCSTAELSRPMNFAAAL